jgi:hypothetical protein
MANTEATTPRKRGRGGSSWISVAVAVVAVGVFLGWLATRQPEEAVAVAEPEGPVDTLPDEAGPATVISADALSGAGAQQHLNENIEISSVEVMSPLGTRLFWIEAGGAPYLVYIEAGEAPPAGRRVRVTGTVREKTDALLDEWEQAGVLRSEGDRLQAEYGTTYIQARRVQPAN